MTLIDTVMMTLIMTMRILVLVAVVMTMQMRVNKVTTEHSELQSETVLVTDSSTVHLDMHMQLLLTVLPEIASPAEPAGAS